MDKIIIRIKTGIGLRGFNYKVLKPVVIQGLGDQKED
jgi:hypothetical protein